MSVAVTTWPNDCSAKRCFAESRLSRFNTPFVRPGLVLKQGHSWRRLTLQQRQNFSRAPSTSKDLRSSSQGCINRHKQASFQETKNKKATFLRITPIATTVIIKDNRLRRFCPRSHQARFLTLTDNLVPILPFAISHHEFLLRPF